MVRNQARRRLRALLADAAWPPGWYLIGARPAITERSFDALRGELLQLRGRIERAATSSAPPASLAPAQSRPAAGDSSD